MAKMYPFIAPAPGALTTGAGTQYVIKTNSGNYYVVYIDNVTLDVFFRKSTDGGKTWSNGTNIASVTATALAVWYDRWSGINGDLIHCAYTDSGADDTLYRSINTASSDTLSSQSSIFAGASTANGGALSITRARGGNLYCKTMIDAGAEGGFFRSTDVGANWSSRTDTEALSTTDQWILVPGFASDNQDIMCIFWDASADEISRYIHDDSANSWAETSISGSMVDVAATSTYPHFAASVDLTNSQILVVAWNGVDTANQDLLGWRVTESAINAFGTTPVLNATDDCGLCAIAIDTSSEDWYVFYGGASDGSDTFNSSINLYYKVSTDDGANWGPETKLTPDTGRVDATGIFCTPRFDTRSAVLYFDGVDIVLAIDEPAAASSGRAIQVNTPSLVA